MPERFKDSIGNVSSSSAATLDGLVLSVAAPEEERMVLAGDFCDFVVCDVLMTFSVGGRLLLSHASPGFQDVAELRNDKGRISGEVEDVGCERLPMPCICSSGGLFFFFFLRRVEAMLLGVRGDCSLECDYD